MQEQRWPSVQSKAVTPNCTHCPVRHHHIQQHKTTILIENALNEAVKIIFLIQPLSVDVFHGMGQMASPCKAYLLPTEV